MNSQSSKVQNNIFANTVVDMKNLVHKQCLGVNLGINRNIFTFTAAAAEETTEDMPPLEGEEGDDASKMEEVD